MTCWNRPNAAQRQAMAAALDAQRISAARVNTSRGVEAEMAQRVQDLLDLEVVQLKLRNCWKSACSGCTRVV